MDTSHTYRRVLRVSTVVMAAVLLFQSGSIDTRTAGLFDQTAEYLSATVGMSVSVAPTEYNAITAELTKKEQLLVARETAIAEREIEIGLTAGESTEDNRTTFLLAAVLFIQLILIVLNYGLDFLRSRQLVTHSLMR